jgi:hypothetical protein
VEVADHVADRLRQRAVLGDVDLAASSRRTGGIHGRPSARVDLLLGLARDDPAALDLGERVLVQRPAARERALAQLDVVALRAR